MSNRSKKLVLVILAMTLCALTVSVLVPKSTTTANPTARASSAREPDSTRQRATRAFMAPVSRTADTRIASARVATPNPASWLPDVQALMIANWYAEERAAAERAAQIAAEEAARERARADEEARRVRPTAPAASGDCANPVVPEAVARRESGCRWDIVNYGGCAVNGVVYGCFGFFQLSGAHFAAVSPWNPNVSGSCYGLGDWHDPAVQIACASRLGASAWG